MILNNFLQNIDFSPEDFEANLDSSFTNIRKKLIFEEEEHSVGPPRVFLEDIFMKPSNESNNSLLQKRIRPFNLQIERMEEETMEFINNQRFSEVSVKSPIKSFLKDFHSEDENPLSGEITNSFFRRVNSEVCLSNFQSLSANNLVFPLGNNKFTQQQSPKHNPLQTPNTFTKTIRQSTGGITKKRKLSTNSSFSPNENILSKMGFNECFTPLLKRTSFGNPHQTTKKSPFYTGLEKKFQQSERVLEEFIVHELIGKGNFGEVYKCENRIDQMFYALKMIKSGTVLSQEAIGHLEKEVPILYNGLDIPQVTKFFYSWRENSQLFFIHEYQPINLNTLMEQQQNFTEIQIRQLIKDICTALLETHKLKRAHLNIKPENLFYSPHTKTFKLGDLGFCDCFVESLMKVPCKSLFDKRYTAPEILDLTFPAKTTNFAHWTLEFRKRADVFSLGCVVYELMCGHIKRLKSDHELENLPQFSVSLKNLIRKMLITDPSSRLSLQTILQQNCNEEQMIFSYLSEKVQKEQKKLKRLEERLTQINGGREKAKHKKKVSIG